MFVGTYVCNIHVCKYIYGRWLWIILEILGHFTLFPEQVDILISKYQALQILYLKHCVYNNEIT